jgi:hypothetical protein
VYFMPASAALMDASVPVKAIAASAAPSPDAKVRTATPERSSVPWPPANVTLSGFAPASKPIVAAVAWLALGRRATRALAPLPGGVTGAAGG